MNYDKPVITYFDIARLVANEEFVCYLYFDGSGEEASEITEVIIQPGIFALKTEHCPKFNEAVYCTDSMGCLKDGVSIFLEEENVIAIKRPTFKRGYKIRVSLRKKQTVDVLSWLRTA